MEGYLNARDFGASGSEFKTEVKSTAGKNEFLAEDIGDFKVGDEVVVLGANIHVEESVIYDRRDWSALNPRPWKYRQPLEDKIEILGYDGSQGDWMVYFIDIYPENPGKFSYSNDYGVNWYEYPLKDGFTDVGEGIRVKINDFPDIAWGCTAAVTYSSRLVATVEKIEGNKIILSKAANITAVCEIMHSDTGALQRAIDTAITEKKNLYLPNGRYRLTGDLWIRNPEGFVFEGESGVNTVIDYSLGANGVGDKEGTCFKIFDGTDVTVKNLFMVGSLGYKDRKKGAKLGRGGDSVYGFYFKKSNAMHVENTQRVLVENCHARKMSAECFYSHSAARETANPPENYTREITYLRCSVEDCARNAFNNNDKAERTSLLYCRVKDIGNGAWEGASRFITIHGCYMCNTLMGLGNVGQRLPRYNKLGAAQHVITDNYFEGGNEMNYPMIRVGSFASQVTIANNVFVNYNAPAIYVDGGVLSSNTPPENVIISGNSIDLTAVDSPSRERYGIKVTSDYVTVSDNHVFVRGDVDEKAKGIVISDDVIRLSVHDNTVAGCKVGIESELVKGTVGNVVSDTVFYRDETVYARTKPMLLRVTSHRFRGWKMVWLADGTESEILDFDPVGLSFTLKEPRKMQTGDKFYIYGPNTTPWLIHHNVIENCAESMSLDTYSGKRAVLDANIIG